MKPARPREHQTLPPDLAREVDDRCDRFEAAWQAGQRPRIEDYLTDVPEASLPVLLGELVAVDVAYRRKQDEQPTPQEYQQQFPGLDSAWLINLLAVKPGSEPPPGSTPRTAATPRTEPKQTRRLRCPHCHNPIDQSDDASEEVLCPACGSAFRVQDTRLTTTTSGMKQLGKFQLLERVGLGAFGAVWRARDTELHRQVALKIPHSSLLTSPHDLERFQREARAAAQLRHPGIVSVHEVATLDGLPAIVSDFISGVTLRELLQIRKLPFRESAELMAAVAEALDYAHSMGLVHRDIKPANIMMEPDRAMGGDSPASDHAPLITHYSPRVMDFGLALRDDAEVTMTVDGQIIGTPAYMSPEQAAGRGHQVDRRSDVYCLGVILYELLCGELPFRGSKTMILHQVLHEEPKPPRRINDKIPRDLDTICLKALAKAPARRYATARELADDLRRFLKGEPIQARPVGQVGKFTRWCRRNPHVAGLTGAAAVALLVGTVVSLGFALYASRKASDEKLAREQAQANEQLALDRKKLVDENFALALDAVKAQVFDINEELENRPGTRDLREKLLKSATERLKRLVERASQQAAVDHTAFWAHVNLGDVYLQLDLKSSLGRTEYEKAHEIARQLAADPDDAQAQRDLCISYGRLGDVTLRVGQVAKALEYYKQGLEISRKLAAADPTNAQTQRDLSVSCERLGDVTLQAGQLAKALEYYKQGLEISRKLAAADPTNAQTQRGLSGSYERLGDVTLQAGQLAKALEYYTLMLEISRKLATADPDDAQAQRDLSVSYNMVGNVALQTGQAAEALEYYTLMLEISRKLAAADPTNAQAQRDLSISYSKVGDVTLQAGQLAKALEYYTLVLEISRKLAADPTNAQTQRDLSISYFQVGDVTLQGGELAKALEYYNQGLEISRKLAAADPDDAQAQRDLSASYDKLGDVTLQAGQLAKALEYYTQRLEISRKLTTADSTNALAQMDFMVTHMKLGNAKRDCGCYAEATNLYREALRLLGSIKAHGMIKDDQQMIDNQSFEQWGEFGRNNLAACELLVKLSPVLIEDPAWALLWGWPRY